MSDTKSITRTLLNAPPNIVNVGLQGFAKDLKSAGANVVEVDWVPPAGGDPELGSLLSVLDGHETMDAANNQAVERMLTAEPVMVDVIPAGEAIPDLKRADNPARGAT